LTAAALAAAAMLAGCMQVGSEEPGEIAVGIVEAYVHDPNAFTQGLAFHEGRLYEGTGHYGRSSLRAVDIGSGRVERIEPLDPAYFGEGIAIFDGAIYQLTWQNGIGFVYDLDTFEPLRTFRYDGEGWGLTTDGEALIMSDGTATLRFLDPETFRVVRRVDVQEDGRTVARLNELEYIDGEIWANVWYDDRIARIDPATGDVIGWLDLSGLYPRTERGAEDVLNGIAYDDESGRLFVTGKNWPKLFELEIR
jgi:glutamine cyclotransferase